MLVGQKIGPFEIEMELGSGAMGTVFRALFTKTGENVAIKIINPGMASEKSIARFEREVAILKQMKHPNIVRIIGSGKFHGAPFYAMEYIEGDSLDKVLKKRKKFDWEEVVTIGQQLCAALQHAHDKGIIHRDLKPSNLMTLEDGTMKLTDFGIAKDLDVTQLTAANAAIGTAAYMSPEQCRGERDVGHKSDLYSMGVLFYELLTGVTPFKAESSLEMFLKHVEGKFVRPSRKVLDIPVWLDSLVCQLLEKKPEDRPRDAALVGHTLGEIVDKVAAQRSAGQEAVTGRSMVKTRPGTRMDESDLETLRSLKDPGRKTSLKRRRKPFFQQLWFQAVSIPALILGLGLLLFWATRPESADKLYSKAEALMTTDNFDDRVKARDGPIKSYLIVYANRDDDQAKQVKIWADEIDVEQRNRQLNRRNVIKLRAESKEEEEARNAVNYENIGNLEDATRTWSKLSKYKASTNEELRIWGLLAVRKVKEIREAEQQSQKLMKKLDEALKAKEEPKADSDAEKEALEAARLQAAKEKKANAAWKSLRDKWEKEEDLRTWYLVAAKGMWETSVP